MAVGVCRLIDMNHFEAGLIIEISVQSLRPLVLQTQRLKLILLLTTCLQSSDVQRRLILLRRLIDIRTLVYGAPQFRLLLLLEVEILFGFSRHTET